MTRKNNFVVILSMILCAVSISTNAAPKNIAVTPISRLDQAWWRKRFNEKAAELHNTRVDLLWLGDSITQNWELDGPEPWRTFAPVWKRFYGDRHAVNLGFKGDSTCHLLWRLQHGELSGIIPKAVVLLIGANNFGHIHTNAEDTRAGIQTILAEIHQKLPMTHVLLLGVLPSIRSGWISANTARLDSELSQVVRQDPYVTYLNVDSLFLQEGKVNETKFLDSHLIPPEPSLHPTAQTQEQIAITIEPFIAHMLKDEIHH